MKLNKKNKLLVAGVILTLYICYLFAFSNTLGYYNNYKEQKELMKTAINAPYILDKLLNKERQLDIGLNEFISVSETSFQNELLTKLTQQCKKYNLKIQNFNEPHVAVENDLQVSSYVFSVEGSFNSVLLMLNSIENNTKLGFVKHVSFIKKRDYRSNSDYLISEIILQKHETKKEEGSVASQ